MSSKEYMGWIKYFDARPYGWREDHRSAVIAQTTYQGNKPLKVNDLFPSLKLLHNSDHQKNLRLQAGFDKLKSLAKRSE